MNEFEQMLWNRNKELMDETIILKRALAKVLISANHEEARTAAKEAFASLALNDPFTPDNVVQTTGEARGAA